MVCTGMNCTLNRFAVNASNTSDSTSKCCACNVTRDHASNRIIRKPHCESGNSTPAARERRRLIH